MNLSRHFPRYEEFDPEIPVWCVTSHTGRCMHRFFDTSPISPSGQFLACLRLPTEARLPRPGDTAEVVLVNLTNGRESTVFLTAGWETQMGANINWGASDEELFFNDVDTQTWRPHTVRLNPLNGRYDRFGRGIYQVSPDGQWALSCSLEKMRRTQIGYGVMVPDENIPVHWKLPNDDGLYLTSLKTGKCEVVISLDTLIRRIIPAREKPAVANHCYYGFHAKWAPAGDRILFTVRGVAHPWALHFDAIAHSPLHYYIFTLRPDGTSVACATDATFWTRPGHHINFTPDGTGLTMNHALHFDALHFVTCNLDGSNKRILAEGVLGSGHPSLHPDGRHILTDCYLGEPMTAGDGTVPLRWIDLETGSERHIVRVKTAQFSPYGALRIDPHPAWDRTWRYFTFNAAPDGTRRVFVADAQALIGA